jgi:RNA polymerase sigma factor (sigma-70 family)
MVIERYDGIVSAIAYEFARKYKIVDADDVRQELWVWFLEHPNKVNTWEALDGKQSIKLIARSLRNAAKDYCQKQKAQIGGYRVEDNYYYDKELVEALLPAVIRGDVVAPAMAELGFVSGKKVASEGGNWFAMMADIEWGLDKLTVEQKSIIFLRYGDGCDNRTFAKELDITEDAARMRVNRAVNNLINFLGGSKPRKERDYTEEEANGATTDGLHDAQGEPSEHPQSFGEQDLDEEAGSEVY